MATSTSKKPARNALSLSPQGVAEAIVKSVLFQMRTGKRTLPLLILGAPGTAKTAIIREEVISQLEKETGKSWGFNDKLRVSQIDSIDVRGAIYIKNDTTKYAAPEMLPVAKRDGEYGLLFLDEMTDGTRSVHAAVMQILWEGRIGDWVLPKGWFVVAAGNRTEDKANVTGVLSTSFHTRFTTVHMGIDQEQWLDWAISKGNIRYEVVAYLKLYSEHLHEYPEGGLEKGVTHYANLRTWEKVSDILEMGLSADVERVKILGTIGERVGHGFCSFMKTIRSFPSDIDAIYTNPKTAPLPSMDAAYALVSILAKKSTDKNFAACITYASRIGDEFGQAIVSLATKVNPSLLKTKAYTDYAAQTMSVSA